MNLNDFSLLKEDDNGYHIGHPKGRTIQVPKKGLSDKAQTLISKLKREQNFADGTPDGTEAPKSESVQDSPESIVADAQTAAPVQANQSPSISAADEQGATSNDSQSQSQPQAPQSSGQTQGANVPDTIPALQTAKASEQAGVSAETNAGNKTAKAYGDVAKAIAPYQKTNDDLLKDYNQAQAGLSKELQAGTIDPNRYLNNMGTGSKIASGVAMILGGIGGGLTHQANPAVQFINSAIQRDIEAQQNDRSNTMNLWKMNREVLGDNQQANLATQNQLLEVAKVKAQQAASQAQGGLAQQRAAQSILGFDQQIAQNNWMRSRTAGGAPGTESTHVNDMNVMQQMNPELYKDMQAKYIPGVGTTRVAPTKEDRESMTSFENMDNQADQAINFAKTVGTTLPGTVNDQKANDIQNALQLEIGNLVNLKRINEFEAKKYTDLIQSPGAFRTQKALQSFSDLKNLIGQKRQSLSKSLGVMPFQKAPQDQQAVAWAQANPTDPRSQQILAVNGQK